MANSIWKTPDQKPTSGKCVCIYDGFEYYVDTANPDCWDGMFIEKWCYFHDLITQADKAERLQKAVDIALFRLENILMDEEIKIRKRCQLATSYLEYDIERIKQADKGMKMSEFIDTSILSKVQLDRANELIKALGTELKNTQETNVRLQKAVDLAVDVLKDITFCKQFGEVTDVRKYADSKLEEITNLIKGKNNE